MCSCDDNGPQLYHMDPSGTYLQFDAKAIGSGSEGAQQSLQEAYHKSITLKEATKTAFTILKQVQSIARQEGLDSPTYMCGPECNFVIILSGHGRET